MSSRSAQGWWGTCGVMSVLGTESFLTAPGLVIPSKSSSFSHKDEVEVFTFPLFILTLQEGGNGGVKHLTEGVRRRTKWMEECRGKKVIGITVLKQALNGTCSHATCPDCDSLTVMDHGSIPTCPPHLLIPFLPSWTEAGLPPLPPDSCDETPISRTSECTCIWRQCL